MRPIDAVLYPNIGTFACETVYADELPVLLPPQPARAPGDPAALARALDPKTAHCLRVPNRPDAFC